MTKHLPFGHPRVGLTYLRRDGEKTARLKNTVNDIYIFYDASTYYTYDRGGFYSDEREPSSRDLVAIALDDGLWGRRRDGRLIGPIRENNGPDKDTWPYTVTVDGANQHYRTDGSYDFNPVQANVLDIVDIYTAREADRLNDEVIRPVVLTSPDGTHTQSVSVMQPTSAQVILRKARLQQYAIAALTGLMSIEDMNFPPKAVANVAWNTAEAMEAERARRYGDE